MLSSLALLSGCLTSSDEPEPAVGINLPPFPSHLREACKDPGVSPTESVPEAVDEIGKQRVYAGCWRRKAQGGAAFYDNTRKEFKGGAKK